MPVIRPLTKAEYVAWLSQAVSVYAEQRAASGAWPQDAALQLSQKEHETLLPQGQDTSDNFFFAVLGTTGEQVGTIWFAARDRAKARVAFLYHVLVWPEHQRQGHAFRALQALEVEIKRLGLSGIALQVFGHNTVAQALYSKLGYEVTNINLFKSVATGA
jgi:ribosomal protein S18 acetylase RimI-like enzyme